MSSLWLLVLGIALYASSLASSQPLFDAIAQNRLGQVQRLTADDTVDVNAYNGRGEPPLAYAVLHRREEAVRLLLGRPDIRVDAPWRGSLCTPLFIAAAGGQYECARLLLEFGHAQVNTANGRGTTPLLAAVKTRHYGLTRLLLEHGADPTRGDRQRVTPLELVLTRYRKRTGLWSWLCGCLGKRYALMRAAEQLALYGARVVPRQWQVELRELLPDPLVYAVVTNTLQPPFPTGRYACTRAFMYALARSPPSVIAWLTPRVNPFARVLIGGREYTPAAWLSVMRTRYPERESRHAAVGGRWLWGAVLRMRVLRRCLSADVPDDLIWQVFKQFYQCDERFVWLVQAFDALVVEREVLPGA